MTSTGVVARDPDNLICQVAISGWPTESAPLFHGGSSLVYLTSTVLSSQPEVQNTPPSPKLSSAQLVKKLRLESGLTWDQISRLFGVSRRAVHLWASGGRMNAANEELLANLVALVEELPGVNPSEKRASILQPQPDGRSIFDQIRSRHASGDSDINRAAFEFDQLL